MAQHPFPDPGHDGDEPVPGVPARDGADEVGERYLDYLAAEIAAGREEAPPEEEEPPGPVPGAPASQSAGNLAPLDDDDLVSVILAARRRQARDEYEELAAIAEYTHRREQAYEASRARGDKRLHRDGEFSAEELGMELTCSHYAAGKRMELADDLDRRLPCTFAGMAAGIIDGYRAKIIYEFTRFLSDEQAAEADKILAAAAPEMAPAELKKKAARLEMKLDPDGVRQRKEDAARKHRRVEVRQEESGNAALSGRELAVDDALTAKNSVWAEAAALCNAGLDVPLREARTIVYLDRLRGLNPWDRLRPPYDPDPDDGDLGDGGPGGGHGSDEPGDSSIPADASGNVGEHDDEHGGDDRHDGDDTGSFPDYGYDDDGCAGNDVQDGGEDEDDGGDDEGGGPGSSGPSGTPGQPGSPAGKAPLPALTNILITDATLLGWSDAPAEVAGFGLVTPSDARDLIAAASRHPRSRWCVTVLGKDSEAIAHGCASGQHPWTPGNPRDVTTRAGPDDNQRAQLAELLRQLGITLAPIAKGTCDHAHREDRYRPSRKLQHLVRARTATCPAPGCNVET